MSADLKAEVAALRRRLEVLEALCLGGPRRGLAGEQVLALYVEAVRIGDKPPRDAVPGWTRAVLALQEPDLLRLARELEDPAPWRVFLQLLSRFDDGSEVAAATHHLRGVIRNVLDAVGLEALEPEDMAALEPEHVRRIRKVVS